MDELSPDEIRRRRLARLAQPATPLTSPQRETAPSIAGPSTPVAPSPAAAAQGPSTSPGMPVEMSQSSSLSSSPSAGTESQLQGLSRSQSMEIDRSAPDKSGSQVDVDSGIENMEVEESDRKDKRGLGVKGSIQTSDDAEMSREQLLQLVCKILRVSWTQPARDLVHLPALAADFQAAPHGAFSDWKDLVGQVLVEVIVGLTRSDARPPSDPPVSADGAEENPFAGLAAAGALAPSQPVPVPPGRCDVAGADPAGMCGFPRSPGACGGEGAGSSSNSSVAMGGEATAPCVPTERRKDLFAMESCAETHALNYLVECFDRVAMEERAAPKVS